MRRTSARITIRMACRRSTSIAPRRWRRSSASRRSPRTSRRPSSSSMTRATSTSCRHSRRRRNSYRSGTSGPLARVEREQNPGAESPGSAREKPALLDWNDDRLAFLGNQEIDRPRPLCRARVLDEVNSLVRIGAERPRIHHVRRGYVRLMGQGTFEHVKKFRSGMIVLRAYRPGRQVRDEHDDLLARGALQIAPEQNSTLDRLVLAACSRTGRTALSQDCSGRQPDDPRGGYEPNRQLAIGVDGAPHRRPPRSEELGLPHTTAASFDLPVCCRPMHNLIP